MLARLLVQARREGRQVAPPTVLPVDLGAAAEVLLDLR